MIKRCLFFLLLYAISVSALAQAEEQESKLKAVFIYNFTNYIEWDSSSVKNDFVIGIVGSSPVTNSLLQVAKSKSVKNKKIVVRVFNKPEEIESCNILFIPRRIPWSLFSILDKVGRQTLTVSEQPGYARLGTAFNFVIVNDKLRFEASLRSLYVAGLKAGSQLLKLAIIVD